MQCNSIENIDGSFFPAISFETSLVAVVPGWLLLFPLRETTNFCFPFLLFYFFKFSFQSFSFFANSLDTEMFHTNTIFKCLNLWAKNLNVWLINYSPLKCYLTFSKKSFYPPVNIFSIKCQKKIHAWSSN